MTTSPYPTIPIYHTTYVPSDLAPLPSLPDVYVTCQLVSLLTLHQADPTQPLWPAVMCYIKAAVWRHSGQLISITYSSSEDCDPILGSWEKEVDFYGMPLVLLFRNYRYLQIFEDISNSFTDICNSFTDILKYLQISLNI